MDTAGMGETGMSDRDKDVVHSFACFDCGCPYEGLKCGHWDWIVKQTGFGDVSLRMTNCWCFKDCLHIIDEEMVE